MDPEVVGESDGGGLGVEKNRVLSQNGESVFMVPPPHPLPTPLRRHLKRTSAQVLRWT